MRRSIFLTVGIAIVVLFTIFLTSCDKKTVAPDNMDATVTMTYTPNPATVNTPIEFNFAVIESMEA
ncbi:MAG: hypothetical protein WCT77_08445, partial [Bacteroidota bacterium]